MKKRYFIFGRDATRSYYDTGDVEEIKSSIIEYADYVWSEGSDPGDLLSVYDGWDGYAEITEEQYNRLNVK